MAVVNNECCGVVVVFMISLFGVGTSDEHLSVVENLRAYQPDGAILVTTPQVCAQPLPITS